MITHEFDLDALAPGSAGSAIRPGGHAEVAESERPGRFSRSAALFAIGLAGLALGAVLAAAPSGRSDVPPVSAMLNALDVTTSAAGASVMLRLTMDNPGGRSAHVTGLVVDGVEPQRLTLQLKATLVPGARQSVDLPLQTRCLGLGPGDDRADTTPFRTRLLIAGTSSGIPVLPGTMLDRPGGVCALLNSVLPRGWSTPLVARDAHPAGADLVMDVPGLAGQDVAGSPALNGMVNTSAYVGDRLVPAILATGTTLRLIGKAPCMDGSNGDAVPMTVRLLVHDSTGLRQVLLQPGPAVARWVTQNCPAENMG